MDCHTNYLYPRWVVSLFLFLVQICPRGSFESNLHIIFIQICYFDQFILIICINTIKGWKICDIFSASVSFKICPFYFVLWTYLSTFSSGTVFDKTCTLSLENHPDGVYLHRYVVTLSLQAILMCLKFDNFLLCKPCPCVITQKLCGCDDTHQDIFFLLRVYLKYFPHPFWNRNAPKQVNIAKGPGLRHV